MNRSMKIGLGAVAALIVVIGGASIFLLSNLDGLIKEAVEKVGTEATQAKVTLNEVSISIKSGSGELRGLNVANPKGFKTPSAFELGDSFFRDVGFRDDSLVALTTAYREAIRNAQIHGSRRDESLCIDVEFLLDPTRLTISVEDEGSGFDHRSYFSQLNGSEPVSLARERHDQGGVGGLGIYLMARCVDRIDYNDRGNRITLAKDRPESGKAD